jgi:hypothetical protein
MEEDDGSIRIGDDDEASCDAQVVHREVEASLEATGGEAHDRQAHALTARRYFQREPQTSGSRSFSVRSSAHCSTSLNSRAAHDGQKNASEGCSSSSGRSSRQPRHRAASPRPHSAQTSTE